MDRLIHLILFNLFNHMNCTVVETCLYAVVSPEFELKEHRTIKVRCFLPIRLQLWWVSVC